MTIDQTWGSCSSERWPMICKEISSQACDSLSADHARPGVADQVVALQRLQRVK